jgi:tetratricopeptide (TPR) repeat protein
VIPRPEQLKTIARVTGGNLNKIPFAVLLHAMAVSRRSAVLELERKSVKKVVVLDKGVPVECRSNLLQETLGQVLVDRGTITEDDRQRCLNRSVSNDRHLGEILIADGLITPSELYRVLQQTLAKKLLQIFTWRSGTFRVCPGREHVESPFKLRTAQLVVTGVSRFALDEEVQAAMARWRESKLFLNPDSPYELEEIRVSPEQEKLLDRLNDGKSFPELTAETPIPPKELTRLLYALMLIGIVVPQEWLPQQKKEPRKGKKKGKTPPSDDTMRFTATLPPTPRPTDKTPDGGTVRIRAMTPDEDDTMPIRVAAAWARASEMEESDDPDAISNEVLKAYLRYREQDAFDLLGLDENASPTDIAQKCLELSRKFAPWRFMKAELAHLLDKVQDLFLAVGGAYGELTDPARRSLLIVRRQRFREKKSKEAKARATLRKEFLDSELQFKKGRTLMRRGMYAEALRQLEFAHDCDPDNSKYRAELAYCRYLDSPGEADQCLVELSETLRIDPECGLAVYYSGMIERELGHTAQADALIRKALKMMIPDRRSFEALKAIKSLRDGSQKEETSTRT